MWCLRLVFDHVCYHPLPKNGQRPFGVGCAFWRWMLEFRETVWRWMLPFGVGCAFLALSSESSLPPGDVERTLGDAQNMQTICNTYANYWKVALVYLLHLFASYVCIWCFAKHTSNKYATSGQVHLSNHLFCYRSLFVVHMLRTNCVCYATRCSI